MKVAYYGYADMCTGIYLVPQSFYDVNVCCFDQDISVYNSEEELQADMFYLEGKYGDYDDFDEIIDCFKLGIVAKKCGLHEVTESLFEIDEDIEIVKSRMKSFGWELKEETTLCECYDEFDDYDEDFDVDVDDFDDYDDTDDSY